MSKTTSGIRKVAFTSLGLMLAASVQTAAPATAKPEHDFGGALSRVQLALKSGGLRFDAMNMQSRGVDGSHAIRTAQQCPRGSGLYSAGGARRCVPGFAQ